MVKRENSAAVEPRVEAANAPRRQNVIRAVLQMPRVYTLNGVLDATRRRVAIRQQAWSKGIDNPDYLP